MIFSVFNVDLSFNAVFLCEHNQTIKLSSDVTINLNDSVYAIAKLSSVVYIGFIHSNIITKKVDNNENCVRYVDRMGAKRFLKQNTILK